MKRRKHHHRIVPTSPEGYEIKRIAKLAYKRSPQQVVIGPDGRTPLYGAAAAAYLIHRGQAHGVPYTIPRYRSSEWTRRRDLATRHIRSR